MSSSKSNGAAASMKQTEVFGHPAGLFTLFFAEMWERFSYYGMRAILVFYMVKDFLQYGDKEALAIYGSYTALVYMTPYFGGMIADRLLGARRAVLLGGVLMAAGQLMLAVPKEIFFYAGLGLLIVGNGFFKPNISSIVGTLYPQGSTKRDGGFTLFYMGINLGAAMSPVICAYIGEKYGWDKGFFTAAAGMLIGLATFWAPPTITRVLVGLGALGASYALIVYHPDNTYATVVNILIALALLASAGASILAVSRGGIPDDAGRPPSMEKLKKPLFAGLSAEWAVYITSIVLVPVFALFVSGFSQFTSDGKPFKMISEETVKSWADSDSPVKQVLSTVIEEVAKPAGLLLFLAGIAGLFYIGGHTLKLDKIRRQRMYVVLILTFFSMLFWSFFEQAGSSVNLYTDRNVSRVEAERTITAADVGTTIKLQPTQLQLGYMNGDQLFTITDLDALRKEAKEQKKGEDFEIDWTVTEDNLKYGGMGITQRADELPASIFQSVNPVYILVFGLIFTWLWAFLAKLRLEPNTPVKFALGLVQLGLGFGCFWLGAKGCDERGMVGLQWLMLGYLFQTTGELCLSPVGLSMITKLSPKILVSTVMGFWFLATAFSQYLAGIISQFTGVKTEGGAGDAKLPAPIETVNTYGDVFQKIAIAAIISGVICLVLSPLLKKWMHEGVEVPDDD
ncbi:MAG: peptide MFS transporter [Planctomycetes bacterium]|nr:peptide MFS transporter [Planctomycetota bacterium]